MKQHDTALSSLLEKKQNKKAYDEYCKKVLCNKYISAYLLKECVAEYQNFSIMDILLCMEKQSGTLMESKNVEDESIAGAKIYYDILFEMSIPANKKGILINIEAQNKENPGYSLLKRAIYYCSRLLARQKNGTGGFSHSHYDEMKKVYSIWICLKHTKKKDGKILHYRMEESPKDKFHTRKEDYAMQEIIFLYPSKDHDYEKEKAGIMELLHLLFLSKDSVANKKRTLEEKYGIPMRKAMEEEVEEMCNFSEYWLEEGMEAGMAEGMKAGMKAGMKKGLLQGKQEGSRNTMVELLRFQMTKKHLSLVQAMEELGIDLALLPTLANYFPEKDNEKYTL